MTTIERQHGTLAKRQLENCSCQPCRDAGNTWARNRRRQQAYGRWQPYTDAQPVREHVQQLIASGINWRRVAELAQVSTGTVGKLLYGKPNEGKAPSKRIRPEAARRLLAVQANHSLYLLVDATGFRRRIQALARKGWSLQHLADQLGCDKRTLTSAIDSDLIRASVDHAGRALYDQLWRLEPTAHGISANAASVARGWAVRRAWAPVGAWDDDTIDDPNAIPDWTGHCGTTKGYWAHYDQNLKPACPACRAAKAADTKAKKAA